ncbi:class I SAM-dependent methyltransferase [Burkholderia ambifaria]|uniref:methyltransferase domain-containing protein n=1 Tax=Burkholderia ambifaria TaxID=152480 RepID=UPI00158C08C5|nr:class I SAM-dependent methyltransferase [Burkholderia ambifaria]
MTLNVWTASRSELGVLEGLPYGTPDFSARVVALQLDPHTDQGARRVHLVRGQIDRIVRRLGGDIFQKVAHLGCGPGVVAGCVPMEMQEYMGFDISPAAIRHAREEYSRDRRYRFRMADIRHDLGMDGSCTLVLLPYEVLNQFNEVGVRCVAANICSALSATGVAVVEIRNVELTQQTGHQFSVQMLDRSIFSSLPHYLRVTSGYNETARTYVDEFVVTWAHGSKVFYSIVWLYTLEELGAIFGEVGLEVFAVEYDKPYQTDNSLTAYNPMLFIRRR